MLVLHFTRADNEAIPVYTRLFCRDSAPKHSWGLCMGVIFHTRTKIEPWNRDCLENEYCFPFSWEKFEPLFTFFENRFKPLDHGFQKSDTSKLGGSSKEIHACLGFSPWCVVPPFSWWCLLRRGKVTPNCLAVLASKRFQQLWIHATVNITCPACFVLCATRAPC